MRTEDETQSPELERALIEAADPIHLVTEDGSILAANAAACEMLGSTSDELIAANYRQIDDHFDSLVAILNDDQPQRSVRLDTVYRGSDGRPIEVEVHARRTDTRNGPVIHITARDIAHRLAVERQGRDDDQKYRTLFDGMRDMVWVLDVEDGIVDVNRSTCDILGYSKEELLAMDLTEIDRHLDPKTIDQLRTSTSQNTVHLFETMHTARDGREIPVEIHSCAMPHEGEPLILAIVRDVTERKRGESERLRLKMLESLGLLAGGIAHDFNNLLMALYGNVELAKSYLAEDDEAFDILSDADSSMERATQLTQQLLTFASGGKPVKERTDIREFVVETACDSLLGSAVQLGVHSDTDLWSVEVDRSQLAQVVNHLVTNARQAMPDGGTIDLDLRNVRGEGGRFIEIGVADCGHGIPEDLVERIFHPYFSTRRTGRGLGLAIVHSVVRAHGGEVSVASEVGSGATFRVRLPATDQPPPETPSIDEAAPGSPRVSSGPASILLVDDEAAVRRVLGAMLVKMGHTVIHAADGREAVKRYKEARDAGSPYDLVLMDLTMPGGMGGQEAARRILQIEPSARLVVSSGYATDPVLANPSAYGFCAAVAKPYRFVDLETRIDEVLQGQ